MLSTAVYLRILLLAAELGHRQPPLSLQQCMNFSVSLRYLQTCFLHYLYLFVYT